MPLSKHLCHASYYFSHEAIQGDVFFCHHVELDLMRPDSCPVASEARLKVRLFVGRSAMQDAMMLLAVIIPQIDGNAVIILSVSRSVSCRLPWKGCTSSGEPPSTWQGRRMGAVGVGGLRVLLAILKIPACKIESRGACRCFRSRRWRQGLDGGRGWHSSSPRRISLRIRRPLAPHEHTEM